MYASRSQTEVIQAHGAAREQGGVVIKDKLAAWPKGRLYDIAVI